MAGHLLSDRGMADLAIIKRRTIGVTEGRGAAGKEAHRRATGWYFAKITSAVTAGTFSIPTSFTYNIWLPDPASSATFPPLIVSTDADDLGLTGGNYWNFSTSTIGTQFRMIYAYGMWIPAWADC